MSFVQTSGTPCAVVVDSRNLRGQSRKMFGQGRQLSVAGIKAALETYGLTPVSISVGLATRTHANAVSHRLSDARDHNIAFAAEMRRAGADVLEGHLVERSSGLLEEKQVDVLCALSIADYADRIKQQTTPAQCIVVLSEDMDLMPAYEFAQDRGVRAYAAAIETVHQRPQQREWILLTEAALATMCNPIGRKVGSQLRAKLASIVTADVKLPMRWTTVAPKMGDDPQALLQSNLGAYGIWDHPGNLRTKEQVDLYPCGIEIDPHGGVFPFLKLQKSPPSGVAANLLTGTVLYWVAQSTVKVRFDGHRRADTSLTVPPGQLLPGQRVLAVVTPSGANEGVYYVGPLSPLAPAAEWTAAGRTTIVEIHAMPTGSRAWAEATAPDGTKVLVKTNHLKHCQVGTRLVAVHTGVDAASGTAQAMPLCCCLP
jgi:hypothetical protein